MMQNSALNWQVFQFSHKAAAALDLSLVAICPDIPSWFVLDLDSLGILHKYARVSFTREAPSDLWFPEEYLKVLSTFPLDAQVSNNEETVVKHILERYASLVSQAERKLSQKLTRQTSLHSVTVNITPRCNLSCLYCTASRQQLIRTEPPAHQIKQLFARLAKHGVEHIFVTGGEPFLREDIFDLLESCLDKGMAFEVNTNGFQIGEDVASHLGEMQEKMLDRGPWPGCCHLCGTRCIEFVPFCPGCGSALGPFTVRVSIDGSRREMNDAIRGRGSFDAAISAIDILVKNGLCVIPSITVTRYNVDDMPDLVNLLGDKKLRWIRLQPVCPQGDAALRWHELVPETSSLLDCFKHLNHLVADRKGGPIVDYLMKKRSYIMNGLIHEGCRGCNHFYVDSSGDVYPCDQLIYSPFRLGAMEDDLSLLLDARENVRDQVCVTSDHIEQCKKCIFKKICNAGCPGQRYGLYMDFQKPDPYCATYARFYLSTMEDTLLNAKSPRNLAYRILAKNQ